jgi:phage-related protein
VTNAKVQISLDKKFQFNTTFNITIENNNYNNIFSFENFTSDLIKIGSIHLDAVKLWWPIGYGQ